MVKDKFTFKTKKSTGRFSAFYSDQHQIKLNGKRIGSIDDAAPHKIHFAINDETLKGNCKWKWVILKRENTSVNNAKAWLNEKIAVLVEKYNFHEFEEN